MIATTYLEPDTSLRSTPPVDHARPLLEASPVERAIGPRLVTDVLVAVDASNLSLVTLRYAAELAPIYKVPLVALIFVDGQIEPEIGYGQGETTTYLVGEWEALLSQVVAIARRRVQDLADHHGLSITIRQDVVRSERAIASASRGASCLVVGCQGPRIRQVGLPREAIARILKQTRQAVLVAPAEWLPIRRVSVVLSDPSEDRAALNSSLEVARAVGGTLELAAVSDKPERHTSILEETQRLTGNAVSRATFSARPGDPSDVWTWQGSSECLLVVGTSAQARIGNGRPEGLMDSILRSAVGPVLFSPRPVAIRPANHGCMRTAVSHHHGREVGNDEAVTVVQGSVRSCALSGSPRGC